MADKKLTNTFNKGLAMDMAKEVSSNTTISDGHNGVIIPREDDDFILQNLKGIELKSFLPENYFPKAIKVFNGIAYIVSQKYNSNGTLAFTEIGTYPSPNWCELFPERIEIIEYIPDFGTIEPLPDISQSNSNGTVNYDGINRVYSFGIGSIKAENINAIYKKITITNTYFFWLLKENEYYNIFDNLYSIFGAYDFEVDLWTLQSGNFKVKIRIFDLETNDELFDYNSNIVFDIVRVEKDPLSGYWELFRSKTDSTNTQYTNINTQYRLDSNNHLIHSSGDDFDGNTAQRLLKSGDVVSHDNDFKNIAELGPSNWADQTENAGGVEGGYQTRPHKILFIAKTDKTVRHNLYFKINLEGSVSNDDETYYVAGPELNTKTGKLTIYPSAFYNATDDGNNHYIRNLTDRYVYRWNLSSQLKEDGKSRLIYASHNIKVNSNDVFDHPSWCNLASEKHYFGFRPLAVLENNNPITTTNDCEYLTDVVFDDYCTNNPSELGLLLQGSTPATAHLDFISVNKLELENQLPFNYNNIIPSSVQMINNNKYIVCEFDDLSIFDDDILKVDYFIKPKDVDPDAIKDLVNLFKRSYCSDGWTAHNPSYMDSWPDVFIPLNDMGGSYYDMFRYLREGLIQFYLLNNPISNNAQFENPSNILIDDENGKYHLDINHDNSPILNLDELNAVFSDITDNDIDGLSGTILNVYSCISEGDSSTISIPLTEDCCNDNIYNVGIIFNIEGSPALDALFALNPTFSFNSTYAYLGSVNKELTSSNYTDDIILLFTSVNLSALDINIICDTDNVLSAIEGHVTIKGYYYCLENKISKLEDKYRPLYNFNADLNADDILLQDSLNYTEPFRSVSLCDDTKKDFELVLQPNYDATVNLILSDKSSKVKFINSRFAYDPSSLECFIPQKFDFNDDNVYSEKYINFTELIRRYIRPLDVKFKELQKGGKLKGGSYIYYFRYVDSDGNTTDIAGHSLPIPVYNIEDNNDKVYGINAGENSNVAVAFELSNFDRAYKQIELSFVYNAGELNNTSDYIVLNKFYNIPLSESLIIIHTGMEDYKKLTESQIAKYYNHHKSIESITQSKNRLLLANEKLNDVSIYQEIKRLALNMTIDEELIEVDTLFNGKDVNSNEFYKDAYNVHYYTGYWRGETYQLGVELNLILGGKSPVFNPKGIDNKDGTAIYNNSISINEFVGQFGENPYGIYRTKLNHPIMKGDENGHKLYVLALKITGLDDFLNHPTVKSISKGYSIVRKDRIKDVIIQGFSVPVFSVPFGVGMKPSGEADALDYLGDFDDNRESVYFNKDNSDEFHEAQYNGTITSGNMYKYHIAPFGVMQVYASVAGRPHPSDGVHYYLNGYPAGDPINKAAITIKNVLVKQDITNSENKFAFVSGDIFADQEHLAASFKGKGNYFSVTSTPVVFTMNEGFTSEFNVDTEYKSKKVVSYLNSDVLPGSKILTKNTEAYFIPEETDSSTPNFFSSKLDQTNINIQSLAYIGVTEENEIVSNLLSDIEDYVDTDSPYGFLTNVYSRDTGSLTNKDWAKFYASRYNEGGYFSVMTVQDMNKPLENIFWNTIINNNKDLLVYGGDCFINKTFIRIFNKIGLKDNFDSYSNIWDYVGLLGEREAKDEDFNVDDLASNSWFNDNSYMALKRARLIPKGYWVEIAHESNYNLPLRSEQFFSTEEKAVYNKDRTFLISKSKVDNYIFSEFNSSQLETKAFNKGYGFSTGAISNFTVKDLEKILRVFYTRIEASDIAVKGQLKNGYREMYGLNYRDYDTKYGYISKVITNKDISYCIFERGIAIIPLSEKQMVSEANGGVFVAMNEILGTRLTQVSENYGSLHPDSCISTVTGIYFFDHNNLSIIQVAGQEARDISSHKIERFLFEFKNKIEEIRKENPDKYYEYNVRSNYNILNGDVIFTFYVKEKLNYVEDFCGNNHIVEPTEGIEIEEVIGGNSYPNPNIIENEYCHENEYDHIPKNTVDNKIVYSTSIYYNERIQQWINKLTFDPSFEFSLGDKTFSNNLIYNENRLYIHDSNNVNYCFFYDKQHNFSFEFVLNQTQSFQTILNNLQVISNNKIPIILSIDVDEKREISNLTPYNLDLEQNITTRRHEVKIISLEVNGEFRFFLNLNDPYLHTIEVGEPFSIIGTDYRVNSITDTLTDDGIIMPMLEIEYFNITSSSWENITTIIGEEIYNQVYGYIFLISNINISRANSDYIEDHLYIQVQKKEGRRIRDKVFRIRIDYDGIDHVFIQSVISSVELSFN